MTETDNEYSKIVLHPNAGKVRTLSDRVEHDNSLSRKDKVLLFARYISDNVDPETAYVRAFGQVRPTVAARKARALLSDPKVREKIDSERTKRFGKGMEEGERIRLFIAGRLEHEAVNAKSDTARITALKLLGELGFVAAFERPEGGKPELPQDVDERILNLLGINKDKKAGPIKEASPLIELSKSQDSIDPA